MQTTAAHAQVRSPGAGRGAIDIFAFQGTTVRQVKVETQPYALACT